MKKTNFHGKLSISQNQEYKKDQEVLSFLFATLIKKLKKLE